MQENDIAPCCGGGRFIPSAPRFSFLVTIGIRSLSAVTAADRKSPDCAPSPPIPRYCWFLLYSSQQSRIYEELLHCVLQEGGSWECHGTSSWKDGTHGKSTRSPRRDTGAANRSWAPGQTSGLQGRQGRLQVRGPPPRTLGLAVGQAQSLPQDPCVTAESELGSQARSGIVAHQTQSGPLCPHPVPAQPQELSHHFQGSPSVDRQKISSSLEKQKNFKTKPGVPEVVLALGAVPRYRGPQTSSGPGSPLSVSELCSLTCTARP